MKRNITYFTFLFFLSQFVFSQNEKVINGRIIVKDATPMGVHIINLVNEKEAISDSNGNFSILAKTDDVLVFSAENLDFQRKIVDEHEYAMSSLTMEMTSKVNKLDEVEIVKFDAVKLGILSKPVKEYTPAERRLNAATSGPLDILLNAFSGRTKMFKNGVEIEKKEFLLEHLNGLYPDSFYTDSLKIAKENIKGFHYYLAEDSRFADALNSKDITKATFLIVDMAREYNLLKNNGQK